MSTMAVPTRGAKAVRISRVTVRGILRGRGWFPALIRLDVLPGFRVRHRGRLRERVVRAEVDDGTDLVPTAGVHTAELLRELDRFLLAIAVDHVEAEDLFLRLGVGAVGDHERLPLLPNASRGRRGAEPGDGAELAFPGEL